MNEFIIFLKDIFMIKEATPMSVGLSQFKTAIIKPKQKKDKKNTNKDIKLSDLMRRN